MHGISTQRRAGMREQLRQAVSRMNTCARLKDRDWNFANYGTASALKDLLEEAGDKIDAPAWQDAEGYIHIPAVFINGWEAYADPRAEKQCGEEENGWNRC